MKTQAERCAAEREKRARLAKKYKHQREDAKNEKHLGRPRRERGRFLGLVIVRADTMERWKREGGRRIERNEVVVSR